MKHTNLPAGIAILLAGLSAAVLSFAQTSTPVKPWEQTLPPQQRPPGSSPPVTQPPVGAPGTTQSPPPQAPPAQTASPVIARVNGRPITQRDYDRIAEPYFARLKQQLGAAFDGDIRKTAVHNVLDELVRQQILLIEAEQAKIAVSDDEIERFLAQDPLFQTNGVYDATKFAAYKTSPQSNYQEIVPRIRQNLAATKMDQQVRARLTPAPATVRAEWNKRNEQVRFKYLPLTTRDVSLDPETDEREQRAYYDAHRSDFERKERLSLSFLRLPLPAEGDSTRSREEARQLAAARAIADTVRRGTPLDTLAGHWGGANATGFFELPATTIPGIGNAPEVVSKLEQAAKDTTTILGPALTPAGVVLAVVVGHQPKQVPPFAEVRPDVKRRADAEKRRTQLDADKLAYYEKHRGEFKTSRSQVTRVVVNPASYTIKPPSNSEVDRWYQQHAKQMFAGDSARTAKPPAPNDSIRALARVSMQDEARNARTAASLSKIAAGLRQNPKNAFALAKSEGARAETLTFVHEAARDTLFSPALLDSLMSIELAAPGALQGPRRFGRYDALWRVDAVDTAFTPSYEAARSQVERAFQEDKRRQDEDQAKVYFAAHKTEYKTKPKWVLDYISVRAPLADSMKVSEAEQRRFWELHQKDRFVQQEEVHARHILISTPPNAGPADEAKAKARADSIRNAIVKGADFAEMAKKFSQDPGSGLQGGDLGFFGRGRMVQEFQDTSFALPIGRVSMPVKTRFGYHLIQVEERHEPGVKPFKDVREEIRSELAGQRADSLGLKEARRVLRQIVSFGPLVAAKPYGGVQTTNPMTANDPIPGVGFVPELSSELDKLKPGVWAPKPYKQAGAYVLVRPQRRLASTQAEFEDVKRQAVDDMKNAQRKDLLNQRVAEVRRQLTAGATLDSAAAPFGGLRDSGLLTSMGGFVPMLGNEPRVIEKAFAMKKGQTSDTIQVAQGVTWVRPEEKATQPGASFAKDKDQITDEMLAKNLEDWLEAKKKTVSIVVLRPDLKEPRPPKFRTVTTTIPGGQ